MCRLIGVRMVVRSGCFACNVSAMEQQLSRACMLATDVCLCCQPQIRCVHVVTCAGSYATLGAGLDLDSLEDAARSASSSRRKEELARRREEEEAAEESEVQPKVGRTSEVHERQ
jgi:hypothetical protein